MISETIQEMKREQKKFDFSSWNTKINWENKIPKVPYINAGTLKEPYSILFLLNCVEFCMSF